MYPVNTMIAQIEPVQDKTN